MQSIESGQSSDITVSTGCALASRSGQTEVHRMGSLAPLRCDTHRGVQRGSRRDHPDQASPNYVPWYAVSAASARMRADAHAPAQLCKLGVPFQLSPSEHCRGASAPRALAGFGSKTCLRVCGVWITMTLARWVWPHAQYRQLEPDMRRHDGQCLVIVRL